MKSFLIWFLWVAIGSLCGYGLSFLIYLNIYLMIGLGAITGSSVGITWNIHRDREAPQKALNITGEVEHGEAENNQKSN